jgi:hypothetical protein
MLKNEKAETLKSFAHILPARQRVAILLEILGAQRDLRH